MPRALVRSLRAALGLVLLAAAPAFAQEPSASDKALAEGLFQEGRKLMAAGKLDEACPKFAESQRLAQRLGTLLNLATCHEKQGRTASAWAEFTEAAAMAKAEKRKDRERYARKQADALEKKLTKVVFSVATENKEATLTLDGKEIGAAAWGTPIPIDPGKHELQLTAPGKKPWSDTIDIAAEPGSVTIDVPALADEATAPPAEAPAKETSDGPSAPTKTDEKSSGGSTLGWVALGVGAVGVGVGSYFGLQTFSKQSESEDHCDGTKCDQTGVDLRDEAKSTGTISTVAFAVGAVGIGVGAVLLLSGGSSKESAGVWLAPAVAPQGGGVTLGGRL